jgi:hypothetical protein
MRNDCRFAFPFGCSSLLSVRSINQSSHFETLILVELSRCLIFNQSVNEIDLKHFISAKLSIIPKQNHTKSNYDRYSLLHCVLALSYAMLPIPCSLYFVSLNSISDIPLGSENCQPILSVSKRLKQTHPFRPIYATTTPKNAHLKY